jgi:hypothetical protein
MLRVAGQYRRPKPPKKRYVPKTLVHGYQDEAYREAHRKFQGMVEWGPGYTISDWIRQALDERAAFDLGRPVVPPKV